MLVQGENVAAPESKQMQHYCLSTILGAQGHRRGGKQDIWWTRYLYSIFEMLGKSVFTDSWLVQDIKTSCISQADAYILRCYGEGKDSCLMSSL